MRFVVVGCGVQGRKRLAIAGSSVVAIVDPVAKEATHSRLDDVPFGSFDAALVCTPDQAKIPIVQRLLSERKHVLVEKPLFGTLSRLRELGGLTRLNGVSLYTAYNHRFEPNIVGLKQEIEKGSIGRIYFAKLCYGNGTARDVRDSAWRDKGAGVLADLGSHLLDLSAFLFGPSKVSFELMSDNRFENRACDHVIFGTKSEPAIVLEASLISWKNTFTIDVFGEEGSAHVNGLCKWGPSSLAVRKRILPSGKPTETLRQLETTDPTWALEFEHFQRLCKTGVSNISGDIMIAGVLATLLREVGPGVNE